MSLQILTMKYLTILPAKAKYFVTGIFLGNQIYCCLVACGREHIEEIAISDAMCGETQD